MSFKLLAIRPMPGTDPKFLKNLKPGVIYKFYQEYEYLNSQDKDLSKWTYQSGENGKNYLVNPDDSNEKIELTPDNPLLNVEVKKSPATTVPEDLYSIPGGLTINISAIVGKNGSGKSSLFDLLFYDVFYRSRNSYRNISGFLLKIEERIEKEEKKRIELNEELEGLNKRKKNLHKWDINELFYEIFQKENELKRKVGDLNYLRGISKFNDTSMTELCFHDGKRVFNNSENKVYHIVLNYSKYSLNSKVQGDWLNALFHKNDNYTVPVVLNPMKTEGNIEINTEYHLSNSRLMLFPETINLLGKELDYIEFSFSHYSERVIDSERKFYSFSIVDGNLRRKVVNDNSINDNSTLNELKRMIESSINNQYAILSEIGTEAIPIDELGRLGSDISDLKNSLYGSLSLNLYIYLIRKIFKYFEIQDQTILENHIQLEGNQRIPEKVDIIKDIRHRIDLVLKDQSHRALKIHQILFLLKKDVFDEFINSIDFEDYKKRVDVTGRRYPNQFKINYKEFLNYKNKNDVSKLSQVPGAYFRLNFGIKNEGFIQSLSSGESHFLTVINTILYHLANIESIHGSYEYINIIFDEVELYFHPEYQRIFVSSLKKAIEQLNLARIKGVNILFSTHSPFILSDIPSQNILRLDDGKPSKRKNNFNSFASNIHDLLADEFFMGKGFMGEFAKEEINQWIREINHIDEGMEFSKEEYEKWITRINLIGEPILKNTMLNRLTQKFDKTLQIAVLENQLQILRG